MFLLREKKKTTTNIGGEKNVMKTWREERK